MMVRVRREEEEGKNKGSGQLIYLPVSRACSRRYDFRSECWPLPNFFAGVPFYDVSFRAFTASSTIKKGTPTVQQFDNRSIAKLMNGLGRCR